jgi:DNA polymerase III subunit alpha
MEELIGWLDANKIQYNVIDSEVIELPGLGKMFYEDTTQMNSIFRKDLDGRAAFNYPESPSVLVAEGINYITFKFGNNWYYFDLRKGYALNILKYVGERSLNARTERFVNLGIHSPYELLNGSFMPKWWISKAKFLGHGAIGICDRNTMAGLFGFQKECEANGMRLVMGYSLSFYDGENVVGAKVYAQSQQGLRNLLRIQKAIMVDSEDKIIPLYELMNRAEGNVLVLDKYSSYWIADHHDIVDMMKEAFDGLYFQIDLSEYKAERYDIQVLEAAAKYFENEEYNRANVPPVLISDCYYLDQDDAKNKLILNKIAEGAAHEQSDDQYFKDVDEHYEKFVQLFDNDKRNVDVLFAECCANTVKIADGANAKFETSRNFMPQYDMTEEEKQKYGTPHNMFCELLEEGLQRLIPTELQDKYRKQMEYEKYIIESTNNVDYLLVQWDTVNWCKKNDILVGCGRGSAAGSLLLYLLGITLVDPMKYNLIFERFLLPERAGLYPAQTTIIGEDIESTNYMAITLENGKTINVDRDAAFIVDRNGETIQLYADELQENDNILFDNRDEIITINEL